MRVLFSSSFTRERENETIGTFFGGGDESKETKTSRKRCHGDDMMKRERRRANGKVRRMGP